MLAPLYQDDDGTVPLSNPLTNDATYGSVKFYVNPGHYDLSFTKPGYTFEPIFDMQVPQDTVTLGTMSAQNANAVAITGGTLTNTAITASSLNNAVEVGIGVADAAYPLDVTGNVRLQSNIGVQGPPVNTAALTLHYFKNVQYGMTMHPADADAGGFSTVLFLNQAGVVVGSINTTASATVYATSSDRRLKTALEPLTEALATMLALTPQRFRWRVDGTPGVGLVADEVQALVPEAVTGTPNGPTMQGIDYSQLVPWLIASVHELTARLARVEGASGVAGVAVDPPAAL